MTLNELVFSDLFVAENATMSWFKATPDSLATQPIPQECAEEISQLRRHLDGRTGKSDFQAEWPSAGGLRLRVERIHVAEAKIIYVCRRYNLTPGTLTSLGIPTAIAKKLNDEELRAGLVIFMGKAGSGKTTTAASFVLERLRAYGGVCWTIENPIELPMQGKHGNGWCYQTEAQNDNDIGATIRHMMRASPNIIFIGEIRDSLAVSEAIAASLSGHLVVATFHAEDLLSGIARLVRMAGDEKASSTIADALRIAIHLSLKNSVPTENPTPSFFAPKNQNTGPARVLSVEPIWFTSKSAEGLRSMVRNSDFHLLSSEVERQQRAFMMNKPLFPGE